MTKQTSGFTIIELLFVVIVLALASVFFFVQKNNLQVTNRDDQRKTAINAMYYSLEQVFYKQNHFYPKTINQTVLPSVDPALFIDPNGAAIGDSSSSYSYLPVNCTDEKCASYTLRTTLQNQADYIKSS
jgi:prepilin-type N-terminal cleavage/methylation domain-containing protein